MGLERTAVIAPPAKGTLDPRTGKPVGADDRFFSGLNDQLSDKGLDRKSTRLNSSHSKQSRMPSSA